MEAVLHSDQGFQYTSQAYNKRLEAFSVKGSHSRKATCLDNACIESFFSHLKTEKLYLHQCKSEAEIHQAVEDYIYFYNYQRFQAKLGCIAFFICLLDRGMINEQNQLSASVLDNQV
ncbi:IS3 family transposase [Paenibacillus sp. IHBB 10380]|uniref:IS3 family transposase n=1 Tax=Paenibacillus sp. IHBB 10380 TaxID=1566358 RepID=UPI000698D4B3